MSSLSRYILAVFALVVFGGVLIVGTRTIQAPTATSPAVTITATAPAVQTTSSPTLPVDPVSIANDFIAQGAEGPSTIESANPDVSPSPSSTDTTAADTAIASQE